MYIGQLSLVMRNDNGGVGSARFDILTSNIGRNDSVLNPWNNLFLNYYVISGTSNILTEIWMHSTGNYKVGQLDIISIGSITGSTPEHTIFQNPVKQANPPANGTIVYPQNGYSFPKYPNGAHITDSDWSPSSLQLAIGETINISLDATVSPVITGNIIQSTARGYISRTGNSTWDATLSAGDGAAQCTFRWNGDDLYSAYKYDGVLIKY